MTELLAAILIALIALTGALIGAISAARVSRDTLIVTRPAM
jgi:hypothetical protein